MDSIPQKTCARCKQPKPLDQFHKNSKAADKLYSWCKTCKLAYDRQPKVREQHSAHRKEPAVRARARELQRIRERTPEARKAWAKRYKRYIEKPGNHDKALLQQQKYWHSTPAYREAKRKRMYEKYHNDPEYKRKQFARSNITTHKRRAILADAGSHTPEEWDQLCAEYDHLCLCCGEEKPLTKDHVMPLSLGGTNTIDNLQPLCMACNLRKHARYIDYRPVEGDV